MPIYLAENQYQGINAHLHSYLLNEHSGWESFHFEHISHLRSAIQSMLPNDYFVRAMLSLQLRELYPDDMMTSIPFREDDFLSAIIILQRQADGKLIPITRLELLSPANKPPGTHYDQYLVKRDETLLTGVNLVELDYLHESRPILKVLPSYPDREVKSYPYTVLISTPHPTIEQGQTAIYGFFVDDPLPKIAIPLAAGQAIGFDLQAVYNHTFAKNRFYGLIAVDYAELPVNFAAYNPTDQAKIQERMTKIAV